MSNCAKRNNSITFFELSHVNGIKTIVNEKVHQHNAAVGNSDILDYNNNHGQLQYLETNSMKTLIPEINIHSKGF